MTVNYNVWGNGNMVMNGGNIKMNAGIGVGPN